MVEKATCPECLGEGYVWYEGHTDARGDDPSDWVVCPVCHDDREVGKEWSDGYHGLERYCDRCGRFKLVAVLPTEDLDGTEYVCIDCFNKRER